MATIADLDSIAFEHFTWGDLRRSLNYWSQHYRYGQIIDLDDILYGLRAEEIEQTWRDDMAQRGIKRAIDRRALRSHFDCALDSPPRTPLMRVIHQYAMELQAVREPLRAFLFGEDLVALTNPNQYESYEPDLPSWALGYITQKGMGLMKQSTVPKMSLKQAADKLGRILEKILDFNAKPDCYWAISDVVIFGSVARLESHVSDIDMIVQTSPCYRGFTEYEAWREADREKRLSDRPSLRAEGYKANLADTRKYGISMLRRQKVLDLQPEETIRLLEARGESYVYVFTLLDPNVPKKPLVWSSEIRIEPVETTVENIDAARAFMAQLIEATGSKPLKKARDRIESELQASLKAFSEVEVKQ